MIDTDRIIESRSPSKARLYFEAVADWTLAKMRGDKALARDARERLGETIPDTLGIATLLGAASVLQRAAGFYSVSFARGDQRDEVLTFAAAETQTLLPNVTFEEAVQSLVQRTPAVLQNAAERTALSIGRLYQQGDVIAFTRSVDLATTERAKQALVQAVREGVGEAAAGRLIREAVADTRARIEPWSQSYSRMVFRTNVNSAVTAGRFRQVRDPDVKAVIPALRFSTSGDSDVRANHRAADGLVMSVDDPRWAQLAPPLGYNCRCQVDLVSLPELQDAGRIAFSGDVVRQRIPSGAKPDKGFPHAGHPATGKVPT